MTNIKNTAFRRTGHSSSFYVRDINLSPAERAQKKKAQLQQGIKFDKHNKPIK